MAAAAIPSLLSLGANLFSGLSRRGAAKRAGTALAEAGEVAKGDIYRAAGAGQAGLAEAGRNAPQAVYDATQLANLGLQPYQTAGEQGIGSLAELARGGFQFSPEQYFNDPAFQFQLNKGTQAIQNSAAARGMGISGNVLQGLTDYGQGLASTYYNDAFNRALNQFGANVSINDILAGRGQRATEQYGQNVIGAGRYAGDVGLRTAENIANIGTQAAGAAAPLTLGIGEATAGSTLGANAATTGMVNRAAPTIADIVAALRGGQPGGRRWF